MREGQRGNYYGVGMKVGVRNGKATVFEPFKGSPAFKAGLRPGDYMKSINDKATSTMGQNEVADTLKGPRGTQVKIEVERDGVKDPLVFKRHARFHHALERPRCDQLGQRRLVHLDRRVR